MQTADPHGDFEHLQRALAVRQSTTCFAQAAVSLVVAMVLAAASAKLFWDSIRVPYLGIAAALAALALCGWSVSRYLRGKAALRSELEQWERLEALKRSLGLDDPAALLPER